MARRRAACGGLTLLELITTLAIAGIVAALAVPAFTDLLYHSRRTAAINAFVAQINRARSEAITRGRRVVFCLSTDGQRCARGSTTLWRRGITFPDLDGDRRRDGDEPLLRHFESGGEIEIHASSTYRRKIVFRPDGSSPGSNTTILFCDRGRQRPPRAVILSNGGRPRVSDGDAQGRPLRCPGP